MPITANRNELSVSIENKQYLESLPHNFGSNMVEIRVKANIKYAKVDSIIVRVKDGYIASSKRFCSINLEDGFCDTLIIFKTKPLAVSPNDKDFYIIAKIDVSLKKSIYTSQKIKIGKNIWAETIVYNDGINEFTLCNPSYNSGKVTSMPIVDDFGLLINSGLPNKYKPKEIYINRESLAELFKILSDLQNEEEHFDRDGMQKGDTYLTVLYGNRNSFKKTIKLKSHFSKTLHDYFYVLFKED